MKIMQPGKIFAIAKIYRLLNDNKLNNFKFLSAPFMKLCKKASERSNFHFCWPLGDHTAELKFFWVAIE